MSDLKSLAIDVLVRLGLAAFERLLDNAGVAAKDRPKHYERLAVQAKFRSKMSPVIAARKKKIGG